MSSDAPIVVAPHPTIAGVATLTLNRPKSLNALDQAMTKAFVPAIQQIAADASIRVVIVQGAGEHFMAGGDIKGFAETLETPGAERQVHFRDMIHYLHGGIELMQRMPIITISKVRGACAGFGMSLAIGCDLTIASDDAYFATAYKAIGLAFAQRQAAHGVSKVVPLADLDAVVDKIAQQIARSARGSMTGAKRLISTSLSNTMSEQLNAEADSFSSCAAKDDFAEGIRAFIEKRHAKFS